MKYSELIRIGTSGWHYKHWVGPFYPKAMRPSEFLEHYLQYFRTVEINNSFYNLPEKSTLKDWRQRVPEDFTFAAKASRYITHMKKLKDPKKALYQFLNRMETLGDKLGPILFQLPPKWNINSERLSAFLEELPSNHRYTFEFRDTSWITQQTYDILSEHNAAFCIYDLAGYTSPRKVTADLVYVRLHGPAGAYQGSYSPKQLAAWAGAFTAWKKQQKQVYCYFDNDQAGYAALNARRLKQMLT